MGRVAAISLFIAALMARPAAAQVENLQEALAQCAACHGTDGIARSADVPNLAGQRYGYLLQQLHNFRSGKRPHKEMRFMSRQMSEEDMDTIARYYAAMPR